MHARCCGITEAVNKSDKGLRSNLLLHRPGNIEAPRGCAHTHTREERQAETGGDLKGEKTELEPAEARQTYTSGEFVVEGGSKERDVEERKKDWRRKDESNDLWNSLEGFY